MINMRQIALHYSPFSGVYKKELLHQPFEFDKYIRDKSLIEKAKAIEDDIVYLLDPMNVKLFKSDRVNALTVSKSCSLYPSARCF